MKFRDDKFSMENSNEKIPEKVLIKINYTLKLGSFSQFDDVMLYTNLKKEKNY